MTEKEHQIIEMIYEAAITHKWESVLKEIGKYTKSYSCVLISSDQLDPQMNFLHVYNLSQTFIHNYQQEELCLLDMYIHRPRLQHGGGIGHAVDIDWSIFNEMENTDEQLFYRNCLQPNGLVYAAGVLLEVGEYKWTLLAVHRTANMERYQEHERLILEYLVLHMRRALHIYQKINTIKKNQMIIKKYLIS